MFVDGARARTCPTAPGTDSCASRSSLARGDGVIGTAPLDGVLHPIEQLDTLGVDRQESACRATS